MTSANELMDEMFKDVPNNWKAILNTPDLPEIAEWLVKRDISPPVKNIFEFAKVTDLKKIKVVIVGQEPYFGENEAHGLAYSSLTNVPHVLKKIYKCLLVNKLITNMPISGNLECWANQGVLLINKSLTNEPRDSAKHEQKWRKYINNLLCIISHFKPIIFMLWGNLPKSIAKHLGPRAIIYEWSHPSSFAQQTGHVFHTCTHFNDANADLKRLGETPIDWNVSNKLEIEKIFNFDSGTQVVFTDGSCYPNKICPESKGGYAAAFALGTMKDVLLYGSIKNDTVYATNQRAEGIAILRVFEYLLQHIDKFDELIIITDSKFWIDMFDKYMHSWSANSKFNDKKNPDLTIPMWNRYCELINIHMKSVLFRHVKSHNKDGWKTSKTGTYEKFCYDNNSYVDEIASYARKNVDPGTDIVTVSEYDD